MIETSEALPTYITPIDLARLFNIHRNTVYRHIKAGNIKAVKIGWVHKIHINDAIRLFEEGTATCMEGDSSKWNVISKLALEERWDEIQRRLKAKNARQDAASAQSDAE